MKIITRNKNAFRNYKISEKTEAGIVLLGCEIKSIRASKVSIREAYVKVVGDEVYLINAHISPWRGVREEYEPTRSRKLLLKRSQINSLIGKSRRKGMAIVPLKLYIKKNHAKLLIGLGKGRQKGDKRAALKEKAAKREIQRGIKRSN